MVFRCYCFRNKRETAFLDETEWNKIEPLLEDWIRSIKEYRARTGANLDTARQKHARAVEAEKYYLDLTGDTVEHPDLLWKLRMSLYGSLCGECKKPFRTPEAKICAECGNQLPKGATAGPLTYGKGTQ